MKKYVEILEEIKRTDEAIRAAEARENELVDSYMKVCDLRERHQAQKAVEGEIVENQQHKKDLELARKILNRSGE